MSRSYRRPYMAITGNPSAKYDKRVAARGWRHVQKQALHNATDFEDLIMPARYEAPHNDVWSWSRDGKQRWQKVPLVSEEYSSWMRYSYQHESFVDYWIRQTEWYTRTLRK
jgi:hypothetical protein